CTVNGFLMASDQFIRACDLYNHCATRGADDYRMLIASTTGIQSYNPQDFSEFKTIIGNPIRKFCQFCPIAGPAVDPSRGLLYWATDYWFSRPGPLQNTYQIYRATLEGKLPTPLLSMPTAPTHIALDT